MDTMPSSSQLLSLLIVCCAAGIPLYLYLLPEQEVISRVIPFPPSPSHHEEGDIIHDPSTKPSPSRSPSAAPKKTGDTVEHSFKEGYQFLMSLKDKVLNDIVPIKGKDLLRVRDIDTWNNIHLFPRLTSICAMDYFRFVKLNLRKRCTIWSDDVKCSERDCTIRFCEDHDLPAAIVSADDASNDQHHPPGCSHHNLDQVNEHISTEHEETMDSLFECSSDGDGQYIDLLLNPERYTGYRGEPAHRVWKSIYEENCFFKHEGTKMSPFSMDNLCYEERIFYRAVSGLHSSITLHLAASFPVFKGSDQVTPNTTEFVHRFMAHDTFITNLYFLFMLELRALGKTEQFLMSHVNWQSSGDSAATRDAIKDLLKVVRHFKWQYNDDNLFPPGKNQQVAQREFAEHFKNITSNILDCVGCDKCKLWGKIQMHGIGTAFKVLISDVHKLHLTRHEITSLINALGKLSKSIVHLEEFRRLTREGPKTTAPAINPFKHF